MSVPDVLRRITAALNEVSIAYMLTGLVGQRALCHSTIEPSIGVVIEAAPEQLRPFVQSLEVEGYYAELDTALEAHRREFLLNVIDCKTGWKIDLIFRKARPFSKEGFGDAACLRCRALISIWLAPKTSSSRSSSGPLRDGRDDRERALANSESG
jgi:hypothetical protein